MPPRLNRLQLGAIACLLATVFGSGPCRAGEPEKKDTAAVDASWQNLNVANLVIAGDLDSQKMSGDVRDAVSAAKSDGADVIIAELSGRRWRLDVLLDIARALKTEGHSGASGRLVVFLNAEGRKSAELTVGTGVATIGFLGEACYLSPRGKIGFENADELKQLMPEDFDADGGDREIRGLAWSSLQTRGGDALLTLLAPRPAGALFAVRSDDGAWKLATEPPSAGSSTPIVRAGAEGVQDLSIDAATAERIGMISGTCRSVSEVLSKRMIRAKRVRRFDVVSGLSAARETFEKSAASVDDARKKAKGAIDAVYTSKAANMVSRQRRVGQEHLQPLTQASSDLQRMEKLVQEYPELMRTVPPGVTEVNQDSKSVSMAWRNYFQTRRNDLETLHARASTLASK